MWHLIVSHPGPREERREVGVVDAVIITRTPLRISLGGGGTDLPSYYRQSGGFLVAAAISKYVYIAINEQFDDTILLKYSEIERVGHPVDVQHPLLREALLFTGVDSGIEISAMADIPAGTGLGSSGTFTVGLLRALHAHKHESISNVELAQEACHVEIDRLGEPIGKQDQYAAAVGGITTFEFHTDDQVKVAPVRLSPVARAGLEDNLLLFYTGIRRSASEVLAVEQGPGTDLHENLDAVRAVGHQTLDALPSRMTSTVWRASPSSGSSSTLGHRAKRISRSMAGYATASKPARQAASSSARAAEDLCSSTRRTSSTCAPRWLPKGSKRSGSESTTRVRPPS